MDAYVTVTDASGRILFRRRASAEEIAGAVRAAEAAERAAREALARIAVERGMLDAGEASA